MVRFTRNLVLTITALSMIASLAQGQEKENPFKKAKVGDWVRYTKTVEYKKEKNETTTKMTVTDIEDGKVTLKVVETVGDMKTEKTTVIDLTDAYNPSRIVIDQKGKVLDTGKEKIKVGDKTYECAWTKLTIPFGTKGYYDTEVKLWTSVEVPLDGVVRLEVKGAFGTTRLELEDSGRK